MRIGKVKRALIMLPLVALLYSCSTSYHTVQIETPVAGSQALPENIRSLTLINRAVTSDFKNLSSDSLQHIFRRQGFNVKGMALDSMAADSSLKVLAELLYESGRYDVVIPKRRYYPHSTKFYLPDQPMNWDTVQAICDNFNTDALLVIDRYMDHMTTRLAKVRATIDSPSYYRVTADSKYDLYIRIYDPSSRQIIRELLVNNVISWVQADYQLASVFRRLPPVKTMLIQSGIQAAMDASEKISPTWVKDTRGYFIVNPQDTVVNKFANSNQWDKVYSYWAQRLKQNNKRIATAKLLYNLAVASEMNGNIDQAIVDCKRSLNVIYLNQTEVYLEQLIKRKNKLTKQSVNLK